MKIKSAKSFRQWYKNLIPARKKHPEDWNENFMGTQYEDTSGFLQMYHGDKKDVYGFLRKEVEMAEDGQAIYEFVQNAADSDSTQFYMFYDENCLIVINNGKVFSKEGIKSILNIGQSYGKEDPDKIGRYGIGFKLVHRLVGKSSGLDELLNVDKQGYRGPVLFSWSEKSQLKNFLIANEFDDIDFNDNNSPWLLKILITNFPAQPKEEVKDLGFNEIVPFQLEELKSFQTFLNSCSDKIDLNSLNSGTIFYLKLGENKYEYLEKQKEEYLDGLSTSMHFLNSLETLVVNDVSIKKDKDATNVLEFIVENGSDRFKDIGLTEARDRESDAKFRICFADNASSANIIKKHPNIYKYFPAVKEVNNLSFVIHSNLFELSSNRQNLTDTPINRKLLSLLSDELIIKMDESKSENRNLFKSLFISILMSDEISSDFSGSGWQNEFFLNRLLSYILRTIPTKNNRYSDNVKNVKINKSKQQLNLSDFGLNHFEWFEWNDKADSLLLDEAKSKLDIEEWSLRHIFINADLNCLNDWIKSLSEEDYKYLLKELDKEYFSKEAIERLLGTDLFRFSDGEFYSINEVVDNENLVFLSNKVANIQTELKSLGFSISDLDISFFSFCEKISFKLKSDEDLYGVISERTATENNLAVNQKQNLFKNFIDPKTKFVGVHDKTLEKIELFCDSQGEIKPLSQMVSSSLNTSSWLNPYKIKADEYFVHLNSYLIQEEDLFDKIILPNIEIIKDELTEAKEIIELVTFFKNKPRPFFNEYIIQKEANGFAIIDKSDKYQIIPSKDERKTFIDFIETYLSDELIVLPYDFSEFNDQDGILKGEKLHFQILALVGVDEHKETLVDIIHYNEPKRKLFREISEFRFKSGVEYNKENYEFKILDLACSGTVLNETDYRTFRERVVIETNVQSFELSEIPPIADKIKIDTKDFSLSKILPTTYQYNNLISDLITLFSEQGISREKLNALFGVNEEIDIDGIFEKFSEQTETLQNPEQFFFLIYYHKYIAKIDLSKLGFDFTCAVFPAKFALETEKLPEYLQEWIEQGKTTISNLESIGVYTGNSTLVFLRKSLLNQNDFNLNTIAQDVNLSDGKMLFNTFELLKEKEIELKSENEFVIFKEMVRVINSSRAKEQELKIQEEYNISLLKEQSTKWKSIGEFLIYLFNGPLPKIVKLNEIKDYIFYRYKESDYAVNGKNIYINENEDKTKTLQKVAIDENNDFTSENSKDIELSLVKAELEKYKKQSQPKEDNSSLNFLEDINDFISDLEGTEWNSFIPELKNILELSVSHPKEKQKLFNLIAKIKLTKEKNVKFKDSNEEFNVVKIGSEKYFVHSARGAFAYIHPNEILKMKKESYKMALDFGRKFKIYETAEEILQLNSNHILAYQGDKPMDKLISFCESNRDANKHLLIIDKDNASKESRALLKILNIENDFQ